MNTTYETAILSMLAPLQPNDQLKILQNAIEVIKTIEYEDRINSDHNIIKARLKNAINQLFTHVQNDVLHISYYELEKYVLKSEFKTHHLKSFLHGNGYRTTGSLRVLTPRLTSGKVIFVKHHGCVYTFNRADYI